MTHVLIALALTSAQIGDLQRTVQEYAAKLTPSEISLVRLTFEERYLYRFYRTDGSKVDKTISEEEYNTLTEVDLLCDKELVDPVWNGLIVTPFDIAETKIACVNKAFASRNLPYNARLEERPAAAH